MNNLFQAVRLVKYANDGSIVGMNAYAVVLMINCQNSNVHMEETLLNLRKTVKKDDHLAMCNYAVNFISGEGVLNEAEKGIQYYNMSISKRCSHAIFNYASKRKI